MYNWIDEILCAFPVSLTILFYFCYAYVCVCVCCAVDAVMQFSIII